MSMTQEQLFFISVINLMPDESVLLIQGPSLESDSVLQIMSKTEFAYYNSITLNSTNKIILIEEITCNNLQDFIQSMEIRKNNQLLFEGYDRMEYGEISNQIHLPKEFIEKYIDGKMCIVSTNW